MKTRIALIGVILLGSAAVAPATTLTYNVANDFSTTTNGGSNPWSYGYYTGSNGQMDTFAADTVHGQWSSPATGVDYWQKGAGVDPTVSHNGTGSTVTATAWGTIVWAPNALGLHPDGAGVCSVARWTAPVAGTINVTGTFTSIQQANDDDLVLVNQKTAGVISNVWGDRCSSAGTTYTGINLSVAAGDELDFAAQAWNWGGGWLGAKAAQLDATITLTTAPEPSTLVLAATALLGLLTYAWRRWR